MRSTAHHHNTHTIRFQPVIPFLQWIRLWVSSCHPIYSQMICSTEGEHGGKGTMGSGATHKGHSENLTNATKPLKTKVKTAGAWIPLLGLHGCLPSFPSPPLHTCPRNLFVSLLTPLLCLSLRPPSLLTFPLLLPLLLPASCFHTVPRKEAIYSCYKESILWRTLIHFHPKHQWFPGILALFLDIHKQQYNNNSMKWMQQVLLCSGFGSVFKKKKTKRKMSCDGSAIMYACCLSRGPSAAPNIDSKQLTTIRNSSSRESSFLFWFAQHYIHLHTHTNTHIEIKIKILKRKSPQGNRGCHNDSFLQTVSRQMERSQGFSMLKEWVLFLNCTTPVHWQFPHTWEGLERKRETFPTLMTRVINS